MNKRKYWLGPTSWSRGLLKLIPFNKLFNSAAKTHDFGYAKGGNLSKKIKIDHKFFKNMLKSCVESDNPFCWLLAIFYYLMVFIFGIFFFNWRFKNN